jgi:regulator of sirC expression with transglutaminase-like and TPR domain
MNLDAALGELSTNPAAPLDLAELALQLARDEYPALDVEAHLNELAGMAHEARRYVRGTRLQQVEGLCRYLFHEMGFRGNRQNYYDPQNHYLNVVLERRTGIPISLSAVTIAVGTRADLPIVGVGLPGHYIVKVTGAPQDVLIDPFHGGRLLTPADCENLVRQVTGLEFEATPLTLQEVPLGLTVQRMLNNLRGIYLHQQDWRRALRVLERLRQLNPHDVVLRRDLGVCLLQQGQPGPAVTHLQAYMNGAPEADDVEAVRGLLGNAWRSISERN